jgi:light-regulated signal transduction histidine kinase (bacteriophytochrome)
MIGDTLTTPDRPPLDLTSCDREPIHIPGSIQPHGILFGLSRGALWVTSVSANAGDYCGRAAKDLLGVPIADIVDDSSAAAIAVADRLAAGESSRLVRLRLPVHADLAWHATVHVEPEGILLEAEPVRLDADLTVLEQFQRFQNATNRLQSANDLGTTWSRLVEETRRLTGHDRVMLYRFAPDWSGEVVAEDSNGVLPSYLGQHFPASDIPAQARVLYARNVERQIPDVEYQPVDVLPGGARPLDLSAVGLRSVSPLHITYLRNMGVGASMSISILRGGALWGMVACHHRASHHVSLELRQASVLLAQLAAARLSLIEEAEIARRGIAAKAIETDLLLETGHGRNYRDALVGNGPALLDLMDATGLVMSSGGIVTRFGETPTGPALEDLLRWLGGREQPELATDHLAGHYRGIGCQGEAAGILAVSLGGARNVLVWFRPEIPRTVTWAGAPVKSVEIVDGEQRLTPRNSFAAWAEEVRGRSRPWTAPEIASARALRDTIVDIITRRAQELERMNTQLKRSNDELEAFAYIASHDLKEPLRQIQTFGTLLERAFAGKSDPAEKIQRWFGGIRVSSRRLRKLIDDLAEFARLGAQARPFAPEDLNLMLAGVLRDIEARTEEVGAVIEAAPLPSIVCDATQMRQVLQNLIANALKYRHPDRAPVIRISAETLPAPQTSNSTGLPVTVLRFEDNGIGFEDRHRERIFEAFERLHSTDEYEGSGLGLAICRRVLDRHGGVITANGRPGEGATFVVTLPGRPAPDPQFFVD